MSQTSPTDTKTQRGADHGTLRIALECEIPSDPSFVNPLTVRTVKFLVDEGLVEPAVHEKVQLCLIEALRNAIVHGNRGDASKKVQLRVFVDKGEWGFFIEDEGQGFDPKVILYPADEETLWGSSGRGLPIMRHYMDRVEYFSGGSAVLLARKR